MKRFEYDHVRHEVGGLRENTREERIAEFMEMLNRKGLEGWEAINIDAETSPNTSKHEYIAFLKRERRQ
jgi:hypothetical protein